MSVTQFKKFCVVEQGISLDEIAFKNNLKYIFSKQQIFKYTCGASPQARLQYIKWG